MTVTMVKRKVAHKDNKADPIGGFRELHPGNTKSSSEIDVAHMYCVQAIQIMSTLRQALGILQAPNAPRMKDVKKLATEAIREAQKHLQEAINALGKKG